MAMWRAASMVKAWKKASTVIDEAAFHQFTSKVRLSNTFHPLYPVSPQPSTQLPPQVIRGSPFMLMGKRDCGLVQLPTGQIVTRSTDRLIPKRLYSSLKSPCHGKMSPGSLNLFMPRRNISFQWMGRGKGGVIPTGAFATVFQKMKKSLNTKHHLKSCGFKAWTKFSEFLGFHDKAISLGFGAMLFLAYSLFTRAVAKIEFELIQMEFADGEAADGDLARKARRMALHTILFIKFALKLFSSGEVDELREAMMDLTDTTYELLSIVKRMSEDNVKREEKLAQLLAEVGELKKSGKE